MKLLFLLGLVTTSIAASIKPNNELKYYSLPFRHESQIDDVVYLDKRDDDGEHALLKLFLSEVTFMATIEVGSNKQTVDVILDTGSSDFWVVAQNNSNCMEGTNDGFSQKMNVMGQDIDQDTQINCSLYGTFDPSTSDTFKWNNTKFSISYGDNSSANGTWGHDSLFFGSVEIENMSVAVCDHTNSFSGVLGIGFASQEAANGLNATNRHTYENLPLKMVSEGLINKAAYSIYISSDYKQGDYDSEVLFGAIDKKKYEGDLVLLEIPRDVHNLTIPTPISVVLNEYSFYNETTGEEATIGSGALMAVLDTGTTMAYMPEKVVNGMANLLGYTFSESNNGFIGPCSATTGVYMKLNFQGHIIEAPFDAFVRGLFDSDGNPTDTCYLMIGSYESDLMVLGELFLRHIYMVVDLEDYTIAIAQQSKDNKDDTKDIKIIESTIPDAITATPATIYNKNTTTFAMTETPIYTKISTSSVTATDSVSSAGSVTSVSSTKTKNDGNQLKLTIFSFLTFLLAFI